MSVSQLLQYQMILPLQKQIYDYWRSLCSEGFFPCRDDIDPTNMPEHLPMLSLTQLCHKYDRPRFFCRLAGTGFWDLFEEEIQGRYIDELPLGDRKAYWNRILTQVVTQQRARVGVTRPGTPYGSHLAQFWIRLPISSTGKSVDMVLGFDQLIRLSDARQKVGSVVKNHELEAA